MTESTEGLRERSLSRESLLQFLEATGRDWMVINSADLVNALEYPEGVQMFITFLEQYKAYRRDKDPQVTDQLSQTERVQVVNCLLEQMPKDEVSTLLGFLETKFKGS